MIGEYFMQSKTFKIDNISCGHCVHTIKTELGELEGVTSVEANQESKQVVVNWQDPLTWEEIKDLLEEINYPPTL
jgi:copper chaperone